MHIDSEDANLLVPLYAVIGVAWIALVLDALRGGAPVRLPPRRFVLPLILLLAWEALSLAWSASATDGAKALGSTSCPSAFCWPRSSRIRPRGRAWPISWACKSSSHSRSRRSASTSC